MNEDKFEKWLEEYENTANEKENYPLGGALLAVKIKYRAFKAEKPTAPASLVEALNRISKINNKYDPDQLILDTDGSDFSSDGHGCF